MNDFRFAFRQLLKSPGFAAVAVLTLALGIGASTAMFSIVDQVLLRPLPIADAGRLLAVRETHVERPTPTGLSGPVFQELLAHSHVFQDAAAYQMAQLALIREGAPKLIWGYDVTPNFFALLGARPMLGRTFAADEGGPGRRDVVVLNHEFWRSEFGADREIIGRTVPLSNETFSPEPGTLVKSFTVIGVMPPQFQFPTWGAHKCEFWRPNDLAAASFSQPFGRFLRNWTALVRLRPKASLPQAQTALSALAERNATEHARTSKDWRIEARPLSALFSTADFRLTVVSLAAAIGIVLLLACANLANLLLVHAEERHREFAIRTAVGAGRGRLVRQLLTESIVLASLGALAGSLFAAWGLPILSAHLPPELPRLREITLDRRALGFGIILAFGSAVVFGSAPAWRAARTPAGEMMREAGYGLTARRERRFLQRGLVVGQIALSLALLAGAGLMFRSVSRFLKVDPGYDPKGLLTFMVTHFNEEPAAVSAKLRDFQASFLALPGVVSAVFSTRGQQATLTLPGEDGSHSVEHTLVGARDDGADFFETWRIPLVHGRTFVREDTAVGATGIVINETLARMLWPGKSALGQWLQAESPQRPVQVVGVVGDVVEHPEHRPRPGYYEPYERANPRSGWSIFTLRTASEPAALIPAVRRTLWGLDRATIPPEMGLPGGTFQALVQPRRMFLEFLGFFALTGVMLAAIGIYGVLAHLVTRRTREIGVRMALGASQADVLAMTLGTGARLTALGVASGLAVSFTATRFIQSKLFGIASTDPTTYLAVVALLSVATLLACWLPARRATKVEPMEALRHE